MATLIEFGSIAPRPVRAHPPASTAGAMVVQFPGPASNTFPWEVRRDLARSSETLPHVFPLTFGVNRDGSEYCMLANHLVIGRDIDGRLYMSDWDTGYVDHGPFDSIGEICRQLAWLGG